MFPNFTPMINREDLRLTEISNRIREKILNPGKQGNKPIDPKSLEFEVKLGNISLNQYQ